MQDSRSARLSSAVADHGGRAGDLHRHLVGSKGGSYNNTLAETINGL